MKLRLWVMTFLLCATPDIVWAQTPGSKTDDCIVLWNPITSNIYNLPTFVLGYKVYAAPDAATLEWGVPVDVPPSTTPQTTCKDLGLNQSGRYAIAVTASNVAGTSPFSEIAKVDLTITQSLPSTVSVALTVAGAPNLPLNGTSTPVTVGFTRGTPTMVQLSRDGYPPFATWPMDTFFTLSPDGQSLTGNWCITISCWSGVEGPHVLTVVATYETGSTATASVALNVADSVP